MSESPHISNVTTANFQQEVIERSKHVPVLVDFWAPWCNPCKMLMPILSELANAYDGQFHLAKVNTDEEQQLAGDQGVRSLPTVRVYSHGKVADEFNGAMPESAVREFIDRHLPKKEDELIQQALTAMENNHDDEALTLLEEAYALNNTHKTIIATLASLYMKKGDNDKAEALIQSVPINLQDEDEIAEAKARLKFSQVIANAPSLETLEKTVSDNEKNCDAWYQLGAHRLINGDYEKALEAFTAVMSIDRSYGDDAGRKAALDVFTLLGGSGPLVTAYRMKISRLLH